MIILTSAFHNKDQWFLSDFNQNFIEHQPSSHAEIMILKSRFEYIRRVRNILAHNTDDNFTYREAYQLMDNVQIIFESFRTEDADNIVIFEKDKFVAETREKRLHILSMLTKQEQLEQILKCLEGKSHGFEFKGYHEFYAEILDLKNL